MPFFLAEDLSAFWADLVIGMGYLYQIPFIKAIPLYFRPYGLYCTYMISRIEGLIVAKNEKFVVISAGGVGYKVYCSTETLNETREGVNFSLWTYLSVREDSLDLYGFVDQENLDFFEMLIGISGIGPKSALVVLSATSVETLKKAIGSGDTSYLTKMSGIGRKTAEKIVMELRDKLKAHGGAESAKHLRSEDDLMEALKSLGYSHSETREALKKIPTDIKDTGEKIKEVLKILSNN